MEIVIIVIVGLLGFATGLMLMYIWFAKSLAALRWQVKTTEQQVVSAKSALQKVEDVGAMKEQTIHSLIADLAKTKALSDHLNGKLSEQKLEMEALHQKLNLEFRNLANAILEEKTMKFTEQNKSNMHDLLFPLGEKIKEFEKKVASAYDSELRERVSLKTEIKGLFDLNKQLSAEANNLVKALKGDTKQQGNWGELILEKILEQSGLVRDREYVLQQATVSSDGRSIQPDAIIFLPDNRHLIIDSKVSLIAFEQAVNAIVEEDRTKLLKEHLHSVRNHVRQLSDKKYQTADGIHSPDFVFLFLWSEAAFSMALHADPDLFQYAWQRNIAIVSPTTIWANLKTVSNLWRIGQQNRNAEEIAKQGADLYDKLVGFVDDLLLTGKKIEEAKKAHDDALNKLSYGTGNLIRRVEKMKSLGLKPSKQLPAMVVDKALGN